METDTATEGLTRYIDGNARIVGKDLPWSKLALAVARDGRQVAMIIGQNRGYAVMGCPLNKS
jgi:hypothetical protein